MGVFVKQIVILNIGFGFCIFNSIWEHGLKIFFDPQNRKNRPQKIESFPRSVNNFRTDHLGALNFIEFGLESNLGVRIVLLAAPSDYGYD